jgi:pyruvate carboxylase
MNKPKVLVANRSAVAARVIRALNQMGVDSVAVYSDADRDAPYLEAATQTYGLGEPAAVKSYLNQDALLEAMKKTGATALHPGYGFLSENAGFAQRLIDAGHTFIGPNPEWIRKMGTLNQVVSGRTRRQYREDNNDKILEKNSNTENGIKTKYESKSNNTENRIKTKYESKIINTENRIKTK